MKILLVDDSLTERMIMISYLKKLQQEVIVGENGEQAFELYQEHHPDLILLDVIMPVMDGHEVARRIRELKEEWVPIIFLSARTEAADIAEGIRAGGDDYLTKPVDNTLLKAKIKIMHRIVGMRHRLLLVTRKLAKAHESLEKDKEEQRILSEKLEEAHNQLLQSEKLASIGQLAAGVVQEINNPLDFIRPSLGTLGQFTKDLLRLVQSYQDACETPSSLSESLPKIRALEQEIDLEYIRDDAVTLIEETTEGVERVKDIAQDLKSFSQVDASER